MLPSTGLCDGLITRPEESYRLWRVVVCDQETSKNEEDKARYRAVKNTTTVDCNVRKTNENLLTKGIIMHALLTLSETLLTLLFDRI